MVFPSPLTSGIDIILPIIHYTAYRDFLLFHSDVSILLPINPPQTMYADLNEKLAVMRRCCLICAVLFSCIILCFVFSRLCLFESILLGTGELVWILILILIFDIDRKGKERKGKKSGFVLLICCIDINPYIHYYEQRFDI